MPSSPTRLVISVPPTPPLMPVPSVTARTNSLVITGLPPAFFHPNALEALRSVFEGFGEVYAWAPIRSFSRVLIVYYNEDDAESAKSGADGLHIDATSGSPATTLRVYRADHTPIVIANSGSSSPTTSQNKFSPFHLKPPTVEKNFLISPPGSPPVGWEQAREEPPNDAPLAEDLILALRRLQISQERGETPGLSVLVEPEEGSGVGVYVEDCDNEEPSDGSDSDQGEGWFYSRLFGAQRFAPMPTMRPPMATTV